ncbi:MAG: hypothetical protein J4F45_12755 [Pseudomonadales bacterium]|nr:hypothetical protein [Pseudomonadales bacterium]
MAGPENVVAVRHQADQARGPRGLGLGQPAVLPGGGRVGGTPEVAAWMAASRGLKGCAATPGAPVAYWNDSAASSVL